MPFLGYLSGDAMQLPARPKRAPLASFPRRQCTVHAVSSEQEVSPLRRNGSEIPTHAVKFTLLWPLLSLTTERAGRMPPPRRDAGMLRWIETESWKDFRSGATSIPILSAMPKRSHG